MHMAGTGQSSRRNATNINVTTGHYSPTQRLLKDYKLLRLDSYSGAEIDSCYLKNMVSSIHSWPNL